MDSFEKLFNIQLLVMSAWNELHSGSRGTDAEGVLTIWSKLLLS